MTLYFMCISVTTFSAISNEFLNIEAVMRTDTWRTFQPLASKLFPKKTLVFFPKKTPEKIYRVFSKKSFFYKQPFLIFREMELYSHKLKKLLYFRKEEKFLIEITFKK